MNGETTDIWKKYEAGVDHHNLTGMYTKTERCHRFYEGDQWHGLQSGDEELPMLNFIKPICKYKIATVALNDTAVIYSAINGDEQTAAICDALTKFAAAQWEKSKMDSKKWAIIKNACIAGDHYLYCFDARTPSESVVEDLTPQLKMRMIRRTNLYLSDEQNPNLEEQEWIIIAERVSVASVRDAARKNKLSNEEIALIVSDEVDNTEIGVSSAQEVKTDLGKCTSILYMRKKDGGIAFSRSVKSVVYEPEKLIAGMDVYPVCGMRWEEKMGSARGIGVVDGLIANQIEHNQTLARRAICVKRYAFPTVAYDQDKIENPEDIETVGAKIMVSNLAGNPIRSMIDYLAPAAIGADAAVLQNELLTKSRELEGASDSATGQVDPTKTSGEAIKAARDQSAMNLNEQTASYKQFVEDLALIWYKLWVAYSRAGLQVQYKANDETVSGVIDAETLRGMDMDIRVDVSPADPYSVLSRAMALENALAQKHITFEEYVDALDDNGGVPKDKFKTILEKRQQIQLNMQASQQTMPEMGGMQDALPDLSM